MREALPVGAKALTVNLAEVANSLSLQTARLLQVQQAVQTEGGSANSTSV